MKNAKLLAAFIAANKSAFVEIEPIHEFRWGEKAATIGRFTMDGSKMDLMLVIESPEFQNAGKTYLHAYLDKSGESTMTLVAEYEVVTDKNEFIGRNDKIDSSVEVKDMVDAMVRNFKVAELYKVQIGIAYAKHLNKTRNGVGMVPMSV